jgi:hypothetical protein
MAVTEMELNEALTRAASLMSPEGQRRIEASSRANKGHFTNDGDYIQPSSSHGARNMQAMASPSRNTGTTSKLPRAILESMNNTHIDIPASEYNVGASVLDSIGYAPKQQPQAQNTYLQETQHTAPQPQTYYQPAPAYQPQPMSIDYNYIRAIVNECVQANMKQIKEEILNESNLKMIRLGGENKIQLVDNKNNLYESKLEFKKNLNKK